MVSSLDNSHNLIISAACLALAELGRSGPLPLEAGEVKETEDKAEADTKLGLVTKLLALVKSGKTSMKVREKAALAAGSLCLGDRQFPFRRMLIEKFIEMAPDIKDIELHFTIGDALVFCALGHLSPAARDAWTVEEEEHIEEEAGGREEHIEEEAS